MGIMDFFRKKSNIVSEPKKYVDYDCESKIAGGKDSKFVSDISMFELDNVDWSEFASLLKQNRILPNSYIKTPSKVEILLDENNRPKVILEFKSATSSSVREYVLLQDAAFEYVNGNIHDGNRDLIELWDTYRNKIRYLNELETNREGYFHKNRGERLMQQAKKMINMSDIYEREQEFLEKYKDVVFDGFRYVSLFEKNSCGFDSYVGEYPRFIAFKETSEGYYTDREYVIPFTPKTLEHCILHMTKGQKLEEGEYLEGFEEKCREIQEYSCFESEDWDKVIEFGKAIVKSQYQLYCLENDSEML